MEWIEITGRTVAEAVDAALDELGVDEDDLEFEVLEEPRRGIFGLRAGAGARIRARVRPISREKPDRRRRRSEGRTGEARPGGEPRSRSRAGAPSGRVADRLREAAAGDAEAGEEALEPAETATARTGGGRRRRTRTRRPAGAGQRSVTSAEETTVSGSDVPLEEQASLAEGFTRGLVERFGLKASVQARPDGDEDVQVDVEGDDLGLLIGPRAVTLDALQELVRTAVQRRIGGHSARIHVDVAGYRAQRSEALAEFARQAAQRALESGRDQVFEPMSPGDRKIVHDTVNAIDGVSTISEGEEPRRRVVIKPGN